MQPELGAKPISSYQFWCISLASTNGKKVAEFLGKTPAQIATQAQRLERRATITRQRGAWHIENRLLHRYRTTGDILPN